jgi:hypothetical protein
MEKGPTEATNIIDDLEAKLSAMTANNQFVTTLMTKLSIAIEVFFK